MMIANGKPLSYSNTLICRALYSTSWYMFAKMSVGTVSLRRKPCLTSSQVLHTSLQTDAVYVANPTNPFGT